MWPSPQRSAHSSQSNARASRVQGGPLSQCGPRLSITHIHLKKVRASGFEGGRCSKCGSRLNAAHIRLKQLQ
eukprot:4754308-Pyramimonas_sp.AAC.1